MCFILLLFSVIMYPSKEQVGCAYCEWRGRKDKLQEHSEAHHPALKPQIKPAPNALSTFWKKADAVSPPSISETLPDEEKNDYASSLSTSPVEATASSLLLSSSDTQLQTQLLVMSEQLASLTDKFDSFLSSKTSTSSCRVTVEREEMEIMFEKIKNSDELYQMKDFEIVS